MTRTTHHDGCPFGPAQAPLPCVTCAALNRAERNWNECSAMTERLAFERGKDLAAKAVTAEAIRLGVDSTTAALLIGAAKGAQ
jgi:hypothetical protein